LTLEAGAGDALDPADLDLAGVDAAAGQLEAIAGSLAAIVDRLILAVLDVAVLPERGHEVGRGPQIREFLAVVTDPAVGRAGPPDDLLVELDAGPKFGLGGEHDLVVAGVGRRIVGRLGLGPVGL